MAGCASTCRALAIVREIAQTHNAESGLGPGAGGRGTLVTVAFPKAA